MNHRTNESLLAFLLGAVTGVVAGILLAPDKGSETRRKIRERAGHLHERGEEALGQARDVFASSGLGDAARGKAHDLAEAARHQAGAMKAALNEGRETYRREMEKS